MPPSVNASDSLWQTGANLFQYLEAQLSSLMMLDSFESIRAKCIAKTISGLCGKLTFSLFHLEANPVHLNAHGDEEEVLLCCTARLAVVTELCTTHLGNISQACNFVYRTQLLHSIPSLQNCSVFDYLSRPLILSLSVAPYRSLSFLRPEDIFSCSDSLIPVSLSR